MANPKKRRSLADAFGDNPQRQTAASTSESVNTVQESVSRENGPITQTGEVEMVPGGRGEMVPADKPVNMTFTVTAKERYLWTLELKRRGKTAVSVLREAMEDLAKQKQ